MQNSIKILMFPSNVVWINDLTDVQRFKIKWPHNDHTEKKRLNLAVYVSHTHPDIER